MHADRGFTLFEVLIAIALVAIVATFVVELFSVAVRAGHDARDTTTTTLLAMQKMEQLQAAAREGTGAGGSVDADVAGFVDFLSADGRPVSTGAAFVRRWAVLPLSNAAGTIGLRVYVAPVRRVSSPSPGLRGRGLGEARLMSLVVGGAW